MTVTTSRGKTFPLRWMWGPVPPEGALMLEALDSRPLSEVAADFEGCERFHRESEEEGDMDFEGYTRLKGLHRPYATEPDAVLLTLVKPERS